MKRFLSTFCIGLSLLSFASAGKVEKMWDFSLNDEGECVILKTFTTKKDNVEALKAFKAAINRQTFEDRSIINETPGKSIRYDLKKNTKTRFNPFAGNFNEAMRFQMDVTYENNTVKVKIYDLTLHNEYQGYGKKKSSDSFAGKISQYEEAEQEAMKAKGKDKKEAEEIMENINESFNQCQEELNIMFSTIQKNL